MKKLFTIGLGLILLVVVVAVISAKNPECTTIQNSVLVYADGHYLEGQPLEPGYDVYGYNYQARMFQGSYANAYLGRPGAAYPPYTGDDEAYLADNPTAEGHWTWPYRNEVLEMKWNDAWLSNRDCDGDGVLDRHLGFAGYGSSGAWLTNHQWGEESPYFVKIVAAPAGAYVDAGMWHTTDGNEIGPVIWGDFAIIQEQGGGWPTYRSPAGPGLGKY